MRDNHNPFTAYIEEFPDISGRDLTNQANGRHNPLFEDESSVEELLRRGFHFIPAMECHTMLRLKDQTNIAYRIPALSVSSDLKHVGAFMESLKTLPPEVSSAKNGSGQRGVTHSKHYCVWMGCVKNGKPLISAKCKKDGRLGQRFLDANQWLWNRAGEYLSILFPGKYKMLMRFPLPKGTRRLAKPWMGCVVNVGTDSPVRTKPHKDVKCAMEGRSCLCCFGDFRGGHIVFWEIKVIVELKAGDILLFADHLLTHSNTEVEGTRHSLVAFTHQKVIDWLSKKHNFIQYQVLTTKKAREMQRRRKQKGKRLTRIEKKQRLSRQIV
jgi:hypothetical protein